MKHPLAIAFALIAGCDPMVGNVLLRDDGGATDVGAQLGDARPVTDASVIPDVPELPCDSAFTLPATIDESPFVFTVSNDVGLTHVHVDVVGPGMADADLVEITGAYSWHYHVRGQVPGRYSMYFLADMRTRVVASCGFVVSAGHSAGDGGVADAGSSDAGSTDAGSVDAGDCVPDCSDKLCGEDDGCGTACAGSHRSAHGGVNDCRNAGNCGCGVEPNDNMMCTNSGQCRVRCSCDCLPPVDVDPSLVADFNHGQSCEYVFRESGDPTVWDAENNRALCPLDHDPVGAARCTECPPCHRNVPPECGFEAYCTCRDPRWVEGYRATCCPEGICF